MEMTGLSQQPNATIKDHVQCCFVPTQSDSSNFKAHNVIVLPHIISVASNDVLSIKVCEDDGLYLLFSATTNSHVLRQPSLGMVRIPTRFRTRRCQSVGLIHPSSISRSAY